MNSLILTLDAGAGCCLPIAYQQLTQGALYAAWRGSYPQLHDEGFAGDGQTFRLFTFGPLEGRYRVQGNEITFTGLVQLEVRSPVEDLLYALGKSLTGAGALRLATRTVNLGYVPRGSIKAKTIEYYNDTERPLNMTVVYPKTKPYLDVALSATRIEPKQKGVLTVTYDLRDCDVWGVLSGAFSLMVNDELADTEFSTTGIATDDFSSLTAAELEQAPKAAFSSQYYHFGNQKAAGELRRDFTLTNDGKEPLVFRDMKLGQRMSTTLDPEREIAPGESVTFSVMLNTKGAPAGKLMDHIVLIVNDPSRPMREIRLAANIAE